MTRQYRPVGRWPPSLFCLLVFCGACGRGPADGGFAIRDSAGVRVSISTDSVWSPGEGWRLAASPTVQFGTSEAEALFRVSDALFLPDGGRVRNVPGAVMGHARDSAAHMLITPHGDMDDTIAVVSGQQKYYMVFPMNPDFLTSRNPLFRLQAVYAVSSTGTLYAGLGDDFNIGVFPLDGGLERIIRDGTVDLSLSRAQFDQHRGEYLVRAAAMRGYYPPPGWEYDMPIPDKRPPFSGFLVDDSGSLWVMPFTEWDDHARAWRIFDVDGRLLGSVRMPERFRLFAISGGRVLGTRFTDLDVELVEVYPLVR